MFGIDSTGINDLTDDEILAKIRLAERERQFRMNSLMRAMCEPKEMIRQVEWMLNRPTVPSDKEGHTNKKDTPMNDLITALLWGEVVRAGDIVMIKLIFCLCIAVDTEIALTMVKSDGYVEPTKLNDVIACLYDIKSLFDLRFTSRIPPELVNTIKGEVRLTPNMMLFVDQVFYHVFITELEEMFFLGIGASGIAAGKPIDVETRPVSVILSEFRRIYPHRPTDDNFLSFVYLPRSFRQ